MFPDELNPTKVIRSPSTPKKMIAFSFGFKCHIATIPLEYPKLVNAEWYTEISLPKIINEIRKNQQKTLHHSSS